jgi:hypothetical protein
VRNDIGHEHGSILRAPSAPHHPPYGRAFRAERRSEYPGGSSDRWIPIFPKAAFAKIRSDDWAKYAEFDASTWFATAPTEKILELARNGWGDNEISHEAARHSAACNGAVADVLQYVMYLRHGGLPSGYKCVVSNAAGPVEQLAV